MFAVDEGIHMKQVVLVLTLACAAAVAQQPAPATAPAPKPLVGSIASRPDWPKAKPEDVGSIEAIVNALYDVISGPKGQARDWDRFRSLFIPDARLIPVRPDANTHTADAVILTLDDYIARSGPVMLAGGFYEHGKIDRYAEMGRSAEVWSTYESRHAKEDDKPFARGMNHIQLIWDNNRYWIVEVLWETETPTNPITVKHLPK
jgi:hypothetical protein